MCSGMGFAMDMPILFSRTHPDIDSHKVDPMIYEVSGDMLLTKAQLTYSGRL